MGSQCITPFYIEHNGQNIGVPCGKCPPCRKRRISGWSFRLMQEGKNALSALFVTLTYEANQTDLKTAKRHFKLFLLRLNYEVGQKSKYICVPERQERGAVHFHCIFFGLPYRPLQVFKSIWPHGDARFERTRQVRSIASYVAKYVTKQSFNFPKGTRIIMRSRNLVTPTVLIEGLTSFPDIVDYRQPVLITDGKIKKVITYDNQ